MSLFHNLFVTDAQSFIKYILALGMENWHKFFLIFPFLFSRNLLLRYG
jgi:hypothetical protein